MESGVGDRVHNARSRHRHPEDQRYRQGMTLTIDSWGDSTQAWARKKGFVYLVGRPECRAYG